MKRLNIIIAAIACFGLLLISWIVATSTESAEDKQTQLLENAQRYMDDEVFIYAEPLLDEAANYDTPHTIRAEEMLRELYLKRIDEYGYIDKYISLLNKWMSYEDVGEDVFLEAAQFYLDHDSISDALRILRDGIERTGGAELKDIYEENRYRHIVSGGKYDDVKAFYGGIIQVRNSDYWGIATSGGLILPCIFDEVGYENGRAIVRQGSVITAVDADNNRLALFHSEYLQDKLGAAISIGDYSQNRVAIQFEKGWIMTDGDFNRASTVFDELRTFSNGYAAAKYNGKWGIVGANGVDWLIEPEYEGVICDDLGRCYSDGAVFMQNENDQAILLVDGTQVGEAYEDAKPFQGEWAAVKKDGKWGFIDLEGNVKVQYQYNNALSFSRGLAAVQNEDGLWGYINPEGKMVIEPEFLDAGMFESSVAPVKTESGWRFLSLYE